MRASKNVNFSRKRDYELELKKSSKNKNLEIHISGAEGIYQESEILKVSNEYIKRALTHSRGKPDKIIITIEEIKDKIRKISLLPFTTLKCNSPDEARQIIYQKLSNLSISKKAIINSFKVLTSKKTMRGASLITNQSGYRMEPDRERGIRASRLGIEKTAERALNKKLSKMGLNTKIVKEALILASKVASHEDVIAEICISDDPDYNTGYIASKDFGYLRIPNIKRIGERHGGRVFIIKEDCDINELIIYLEKTPVLVS